MPKVTDLISKFEKTAETQTLTHGTKTVKAESKAKAHTKADQAVPEKPIAKRSGRALPTLAARKGRALPPLPSGPNARERKILETLERKKALKGAFLGSPGTINPIMEAIHKIAPKKVFESIKTMMTVGDPEASTKIDENTFGTTARAFFKTDYKDLSPIQKDFIQKHNGEKAFDVMAKANAVIEELKSFPDYDEKFQFAFYILRGGVYKNDLDEAIRILDFRQSVEGSDKNLIDAFSAWTNVTNSIYLQNEYTSENPRNTINSSNPDLTMIPPQAFQMHYVTNLSLQSTAVSSLPPEIANLSTLEFLMLNDLPMKTLPPEIEHLQNLQTLMMNRGTLNHLPDEIGSLSNLTKLQLSNLKLTELPNTIGNLSNLKELSVAGNENLFSLPYTLYRLKNLEKLDIRSTNIRSVPDEIGALTNLTELHLNMGSSLPDSIVNLTNLKVLTLPQSLDFNNRLRWSQLPPAQQEWLLTLRANKCRIDVPRGFGMPD